MTYTLADFNPDGHLKDCAPSYCSREDCAEILYAIAQTQDRELTRATEDCAAARRGQRDALDALTRIAAVCDDWDRLSRGESTTTHRIRAAANPFQIPEDTTYDPDALRASLTQSWEVLTATFTQPGHLIARRKTDDPTYALHRTAQDLVDAGAGTLEEVTHALARATTTPTPVTDADITRTEEALTHRHNPPH